MNKITPNNKISNVNDVETLHVQTLQDVETFHATSLPLKPYPKYKPSGIAWLGDIPEHWKQMQLNKLFF